MFLIAFTLNSSQCFQLHCSYTGIRMFCCFYGMCGKGALQCGNLYISQMNKQEDMCKPGLCLPLSATTQCF